MVENDEVTLRGDGIDLGDDKGFTKKKLGEVSKSAENIVDIAAAVLQKLGRFNVIRNNCQVRIPVATCTCMCTLGAR